MDKIDNKILNTTNLYNSIIECLCNKNILNKIYFHSIKTKYNNKDLILYVNHYLESKNLPITVESIQNAVFHLLKNIIENRRFFFSNRTHALATFVYLNLKLYSFARYHALCAMFSCHPFTVFNPNYYSVLHTQVKLSTRINQQLTSGSTGFNFPHYYQAITALSRSDSNSPHGCCIVYQSTPDSELDSCIGWNHLSNCNSYIKNVKHKQKRIIHAEIHALHNLIHNLAKSSSIKTDHFVNDKLYYLDLFKNKIHQVYKLND